MTEQSCKTCDYSSFDEKSFGDGWCWWANRNPLPVSFCWTIKKSGTYDTWGKDCPCWIIKKSA